MDITSLTGVSSEYLQDMVQRSSEYGVTDDGFDNILKSAMDMLNETSTLQNLAEEAEIQFALGYSTNTHDLRIAQEKANIALQYTIAVRDKILEAYKEIMNMQI